MRRQLIQSLERARTELAAAAADPELCQQVRAAAAQLLHELEDKLETLDPPEERTLRDVMRDAGVI